MTAIKRSFCLVLAILAIIMFVPFLGSLKLNRNLSVNFAKTSEISANIIINGAQTLPAASKESMEGIRTLADTDISRLSPEGFCETSASAGDTPYSTLFGIAAEYSVPVEITDAEREMIAATLQLEVVGKYSNIYQFENYELKYYEMLAVAQIIKNRKLSSSFPDTIKEIIYDCSYSSKGKVYQFATSPDISSTVPTEAAYAAVKEVFDDGLEVLPSNYFYFCATWRETAFQINNRSVLKYVGIIDNYDKIIADATTFYAGVSIKDNIAHSYVY